MPGKRALVTGGTGFIGSHLVKKLLGQGWDVSVIIRTSSSEILLSDVKEQITIYKHDGQISTLMHIVKIAKPDCVFHLASLVLAQHKPEDVVPLIESNIAFSTALVEAMVLNGATCLITTGTSWQHYQNEDYNPVCLYAATKEAFDKIVKFYVETAHLKVVNLKLFDTYGPRDPRDKLFTLLTKTRVEQHALSMSHGEQLLNLVYIDDVTDAYLVAADRLLHSNEIKHESFAVDSDELFRLRDIVSKYEEVFGTQLKINWGARPYREREVMIPWNSGTRLPGWHPKVTLEAGLLKLKDSEFPRRNHKTL